MRPQLPMPFLQDAHENPVKAAIDDTHERIAHLDREPQRPAQERHGDDLVLPGIQRPLMLPRPHRMLGQGREVIDGPEVVFIRAARTHEIAEQVQMKGQK
jgi:hypothetical protein